MQAFTTLQATAVPLLRDDIDTDLIIRVEPLFGGVPRERLGEFCFQSLRQRPDGSPAPGFVLDQPAYSGAEILLAGANFGCGSSREGAVWALMGRGFRCIIAPSFGEIFRGNCFQNGLLPITLERSRIEAIARQIETAPRSLLRIDLARCEVGLPDGSSLAFQVPAMNRAALMQGLDEVQLTLAREDEIAAFQRRDALRRPWIYFSEIEPCA